MCQFPVQSRFMDGRPDNLSKIDENLVEFICQLKSCQFNNRSQFWWWFVFQL